MRLTRFACFTVVASILATLIGPDPAASHRALPAHLRECYTNAGVFVPALPLNLQVVLDILRKIETRTHTAVSMRVLSAGLVRRFKLDGVAFSPQLPTTEGVLKYAASGPQRAKNRIVEELIPGDGAATNLPVDELLERDERCLLHFAMSNTVWEHYDPRERSYCGPGASERLFGRSMTPEEIERCPKEGGVILTPYNTVSFGSLMGAVAAAMEPQVVKTKLLMRMPLDDDDDDDENQQRRVRRTAAEPFDDDEIDLVVPTDRASRNKSEWMEAVSISDTQIDNVWIATLAGELAEMVIYQGPIYEDRMYLGATGFWNSSIRPKVFYVGSRKNNFDATRAEIVGGVDGLIIAKYLDTWTSKFQSLRLSQVLDMYYSERGIAFDRSVRACKRGLHFPRFGSKGILEEQTYAASQVLAYLNSVAAISDEMLQRLVVRSVDYFSRYVENYLFTEQQCRSSRRRQSRVELIVAFDGAFTRGYTADFLGVLVDDFDISMYGSKMGLIHGQTGEWLLNMTSSPAKVHQSLNKLSKIKWPTNMKMNAIFQTISTYLDESWEEKRNASVIGDYGQAVALLLPRITMTDDEAKQALDTLKDLKERHPEVHFMYYTMESKADLLRPFILTDEDRLVRSLDIDDIPRIFSTVPSTLRPAGCNRSGPGERLQYEDYVNPSESVTYRLHPKWRAKAKSVTVTLHGVGYGNLKVCTWNQRRLNAPKMDNNCKDLSHYGDVTFTDYNDCTNTDDCPNTYFEVKSVSTVTRCTEIHCKTPDQVRFIMRIESLQCSSSNRLTFVNLLLIIPILFTTSLF